MLTITKPILTIITIALVVAIAGAAIIVATLPRPAGAVQQEPVVHHLTDLDTLPSLTIQSWHHTGGDRVMLIANPVTLWTGLDSDGDHPGYRMVEGVIRIEVDGQQLSESLWQWPFRQISDGQGGVAYQGAIVRGEDLIPTAEPGDLTVHLSVNDAPDVHRMTIGDLALSIR